MREGLLRQIISVLNDSIRSEFLLELESFNPKAKYEITCNAYKSVEPIKVKSVSETGVELESNYSNVNDIPLVECKVLSLTETRRTHIGTVSSVNKILTYRNIELFLSLFKIMRENAVFVIQDEQETRVAYYINSRVFYIEESENFYEVIETDMFRLFNSMPKAEILMFSELPRPYSCGTFYAEQNRISKARGKEMKNTKNGVGVR
jgi:hypothetical protein